MTERYWQGMTPLKCEVTGKRLNGVMYDAKLPGIGGAWALVCQDAFTVLGGKLGTGHGQRYDLQGNGRFLLVAGSGDGG